MHMLSFDKADERLSRRLKRRFGIHSETHVNNPTSLDIIIVPKREEVVVQFDSDYAFYFNSHPGHEDDYVDATRNDDVDPEYQTFLNHLSENDIAFNDQMPLRTMSEKDGHFLVDDDIMPNNSKRFKDVPSRDGFKTKRLFRGRDKNKEKPKTLRSVPNKKRKISSTVKDITPNNLKTVKDVPSRHGVKTKRVFRNSDKYKGKSKALGSVPNKKSKISSTVKNVKLECGVNVPATQKPRPLMPEVKQEMGSAMEEEEDCYESFLKCMKLDGANLVMVTKDGKMTKYEEDDENASDSDLDIEMTDAPQLGAPSPFVTSKIYYLDGKSNRSDSKFREKLTNIFRKPFDQKEYNELYKEASERKPLERCKESRGRTRGCVILESVGKSYLDHHTDLENEIHSVRHNPYMVLKLLRGFFFWLKNVAEEGGFRPWSDESCLEEIRQR